MKIILAAFLALILALPSYMGHTVTVSGWGSGIAYEVWLLFNAIVVIGLYFTTRNIFSVWGGILLTGLYMGLFAVYTGITPIQVSLANIGFGVLAGILVYVAATTAQFCLLKTGSRESYSVCLAMLTASLISIFI
ncbi:MAG: hypothetical protein IJ474_05440 [Mailhella sp.]|nr:hypothetical protein [Mailhella sp.]MBQ9106010.1 hypothetical protein [Mailhella sp.]